jgi:D-lyxose ketol-isomerase
MMQETQRERLLQVARQLLLQSGIRVREEELEKIYLEDFGLGEFEETGLALLQIVDTELLNIKIMVLLPGQTCPEHRHRPQDDYPGKEETFRCQWGSCYLFIEGPPTSQPSATPPARRKQHYTLTHELPLGPGDQYTALSNTPHWFQAGPQGAVVWSFCSRVAVGADLFTDPQITGPTQYGLGKASE